MGIAPAGDTTILAQESTSDKIFLLPNGTFFYELLLFAVIFWIFAKFIVPPIRQALHDREERVRLTQRNNEEADEQYAAAKRRHDEVLSGARGEATSIREEARASAREHAAGVRGQAEQEVSEARQRADRELDEQRERARGDVLDQLPSLAGTLAERMLGRPLSDDTARRSTVEEYVGSLGRGSGEARSGASTTASAGSSVTGGSEES